MKLLKDLLVTRKELQGWENNLVWARDGTLYITSYPDICIGQPTYRKDVGNNSKHLFHIRDRPLAFENKFEFDSAGRNTLLNSQPVSFAKLVRTSPCESLLAVLTNNLNVHVFREERLLCNLDEPEKNLEQRSYHCMEWSPDGDSLAVGNENGEVIVYNVPRVTDGSATFTPKRTFQMGGDIAGTWVVHICWRGDDILAFLDDNSIYLINLGLNRSLKRVKDSSRFKIVDYCVKESTLLYTDSCHFNRLDLQSGQSDSVTLGPGDEFRIVPLQKTNKVILISNKSSCQVKLEDEMMLMPDSVIAPQLERKFKRWSAVNNELGKHESTMLIYGISLSPDGYSVAINYSMERVSMKYKIASEHQMYITFIPLCESWSISQNATGLAWYQTYQIYQCSLPSFESLSGEDNRAKCDVNMPLESYIKMLLSSNEMNNLRFLNFIEERPSVKPFRSAIFEYAVARSSEITNLIDKASVQSLASILGHSSPVKAETIEFKSEFISETFDFEKNGAQDPIISEQQHEWKRCALTLLPILTTKVKVCPISNQRIIDIGSDIYNDYGWFTRTLLEVLKDESIYSGTTMIS